KKKLYVPLATLFCIGIGLFVLAYAARFKYEVIASRCVGCGDCYRVCKDDAVRIYKGKAVIDFEKCTSCALCIIYCPYQAVRKCDLPVPPEPAPAQVEETTEPETPAASEPEEYQESPDSQEEPVEDFDQESDEDFDD
ncbi:MAG: 4Fe-4S binding protein, partial [Chitinivibrionales bacterium]|nr:4Fe-4S binding protein [Chitinivibrionales bacterium]